MMPTGGDGMRYHDVVDASDDRSGVCKDTVGILFGDSSMRWVCVHSDIDRNKLTGVISWSCETYRE